MPLFPLTLGDVAGSRSEIVDVRDVFDGSEKCVNNNLKGNVQRFCKTQGYVDFIAELAVYTPRKDQKR